MTQLLWYVKAAFALFTVSFILDFPSLFEVLNALLKGWVDVYSSPSTVFDFLSQIF